MASGGCRLCAGSSAVEFLVAASATGRFVSTECKDGSGEVANWTAWAWPVFCLCAVGMTGKV